MVLQDGFESLRVWYCKTVLNRHLTRGHAYRIRVAYIARSCKVSHFFSHRVVRLWNALPDRVVESPSLTMFISRVHRLSYSILSDSLIR